MKTGKLIYGCGADSYYATKLEMHDPYVWLEDADGKSHIILSALEVSRGRKFAKVDHVHAMDDLQKAIRQATPGASVGVLDMVKHLADQLGVGAFVVPSTCPASVLEDLTAMGLQILVKRGTYFESRIIKSADEIEMIRECQQINEQAFARAFEVLNQATIEKDLSLKWNGNPLTSEIIQGVMNSKNAELGCIGFNGGPIVAGGEQGADPHNRGNGVLYANEFIIIDSFPNGGNFYNGDLTRTVLKGEASDWHLDVYNAVKKAQQHGLDIIKEGISGADVHKQVDDVLIKLGYDTGVDSTGTPYGFFHGTGHALGLEVHDDGPGVSPRNTDPLKAGMVVTVEPGLYYPNKGGVRIEDIVAVTKDGIDNLTTLPKELLVHKL